MKVYEPFPNTHWSLVRRAGWGDERARAEALVVLLERYMPALESYLRVVKRMAEGDVEEILQAFVADKMLAEAFLKHADERRGKFRTFLLTCLNHFCVSRRRAESVRKTEYAEMEMLAGGDECGAGAIVEAAWARALVREVLGVMEEECRRTQRMDVWRIFEGRVLREIFGEDPLGYEALALELKLESPTQAANLLVTGKRMYGRLLRRAVAEYEREEVDQETEIAELCAILCGVRRWTVNRRRTIERAHGGTSRKQNG